MLQKEELLHQWWQTKNIDIAKLNQSGIQIIDFGEYNRFENGPDFQNAKVRIGTILWCGSIEIHVRSSDWNAHGHQWDANYNNVILHIVQKDDVPIYNLNGEKILTVELFPSDATSQKRNQFIPCERQFSSCARLTIINELEHSLIDRLNRKSAMLQFQEMIYQFDYQAVFWRLLFRSFGNKVHQHAFEELFIASYPYLKNEKNIRVLLLGLSGFELTESDKEEWEYIKTKHQLQNIKTIQWKTKGFYASSHPIVRIQQLAKLFPFFNHIDWTTMRVEYWLMIREKVIQQQLLTSTQIDLILINAIVLFYWWFYTEIEEISYREKAIELLMNLPPEKNNIIKQWKAIGFMPESAFDTQALLELKNQKCNFTRCLECKIGQKLYEFPD